MNKKENFIFKGVNNEELKDHQSSVWVNVYKQVINEQSVVYDIGAFRGVTVRGFANLGCEVHAFEGSPRNYDYLVENTKELKNVFCHKVGLHKSNYKTITRFKDCIGNHNYSINPQSLAPPQEINYVRLDDYVACNQIRTPNYIKIDIEGMESVVLKTCEKFISVVKPVWQLSLHESFSGYGDDYPGWVTSELGGFDFSSLLNTYVAFIPSKGNLVKTDEISGCKEYLLIPKDHKIFLIGQNKGLLY
jgi:FkbM family methyltransferase